jgi:hypothetical protein
MTVHALKGTNGAAARQPEPWELGPPPGRFDDEPAISEVIERRALTPAAVTARWRDAGALVRLPTGWPSLDAATKGGLEFGRTTLLVGAPNVGKTAVATALGYRWARDGIPVGMHGIDEWPDDLHTRVAQMAGFLLEDIERAEPRVLDEIDRALATLPIRYYDADWSIEEAAEDLTREFHRPCVYIADSTQTIRSRDLLRADSMRAIVDANLRGFQYVARRLRHLVLGTSEMNRGGYRSEDAAENYNDMAAGKESGAIEYVARVQLVLRSVKGHPGVIAVRAPKVKRGDECSFHLRLNRVTHAISECGVPAGLADDAAEREQAKLAKARKAVDADARTLEMLIASHPGIGERALRAELKARGHAWGVPRIEAAKRALGARLENRGGNARDVRWHVTAEGRADA